MRRIPHNRARCFHEADKVAIMKSIKLLLGLCCILMTGLATPAWADHGHSHSGHFHGGHYHHHGHVGIVIGGPLWFWGPGFYDPYDGYPPVTVVPARPPVYIEQSQPDSLAPGYWYYCDQPAGYYPYVKQCQGGWRPVAPQQAPR